MSITVRLRDGRSLCVHEFGDPAAGHLTAWFCHTQEILGRIS